MVHLRLDSLPSLFTFITLLGADAAPQTTEPAGAEGQTAEDATAATTPPIKKRPLEVHGLRLVELSDRASSVMRVTEGEAYYSSHDPVVNAFRMFSQLNDVAVSGRVSVVPVSSYSETLMTHAAEVSSDFALIPWGEYGNTTEDQSLQLATAPSERFKSGTHLQFIEDALQRAVRTCNTGIFIDNGLGGSPKTTGGSRPTVERTVSTMSALSYHDPPTLPLSDKSHHVFLPFFGGEDDRVALRFALQLAKNPLVTLTVTHLSLPDEYDGEGNTATNATGATTAGHGDSSKHVESLTAQDLTLLATLRSSLPEEYSDRVTFNEVDVSGTRVAIDEAFKLAQAAVGKSPGNAGDIVVLGRRHAQLGDGGRDINPDLGNILGVVTDRMVSGGVKASLLVIQAGGGRSELR